VVPAVLKKPEAEPSLVCPAEVHSQSSDIASLEGMRIAKICIHGVPPKEAEDLRELLAEREGDVFTRGRAAADIPALFATHLVDDVRITAVPAGSRGLILDVALRPSLRVAKVTFHGASALGDAALEKSFPLQPGAPLDRAKLRQALHDIELKYAEQAFASAHTTFTIESNAAGARIQVDVEEGPVVHITKVAFSGLSKVKEADLLSAMMEKTGDPCLPDRAERDTLLINAALYDRGHAQATVEMAQQVVGAEATLTFAVNEGPAFHIGKLHMKGVPLGEEKDVLAALSTKPKSLFSRSGVMKDILALDARAKARGLEVDIAPDTELDVEKKLIHLTFDITPKPPRQRPSP
jgi:outer membrane protein insertion porin family